MANSKITVKKDCTDIPKPLTSGETINTIMYVQNLINVINNLPSFKKWNSRHFAHAGDVDSQCATEEYINGLRKILAKTLPTKNNGDKEKCRISNHFIERFQSRVCESSCFRVRKKNQFVGECACKFIIQPLDDSDPESDWELSQCSLEFIYEALLVMQNDEEYEKVKQDNKNDTSGKWIARTYITSLEKKRYMEALDHLERYFNIMMKVKNSEEK